MLLERKNGERYDDELHMVISGVCKLNIPAKIKQFTQNMSALKTFRKNLKRLYVTMIKSVNFGIISVQSYFEIKVERWIHCLLPLSMLS